MDSHKILESTIGICTILEKFEEKKDWQLVGYLVVYFFDVRPSHDYSDIKTFPKKPRRGQSQFFLCASIVWLSWHQDLFIDYVDTTTTLVGGLDLRIGQDPDKGPQRKNV